MRCSAAVFAGAAVAALTVLALAGPTHAFTCCWFKNQYADMYGVVSVGQGYQCPGIQDWGSARKSWFVVNPLDCYNGPPNSTTTYIAGSTGKETTPGAEAVQAPAKGSDADVEYSFSSSNDPCHCCFYAKPVYYMTQPIQCIEPNPASGSYCSSTYEGLTLGGQWIVGNLDFPNQACFFETFTQTSTA